MWNNSGYLTLGYNYMHIICVVYIHICVYSTLLQYSHGSPVVTDSNPASTTPVTPIQQSRDTRRNLIEIIVPPRLKKNSVLEFKLRMKQAVFRRIWEALDNSNYTAKATPKLRNLDTPRRDRTQDETTDRTDSCLHTCEWRPTKVNRTGAELSVTNKRCYLRSMDEYWGKCGCISEISEFWLDDDPQDKHENFCDGQPDKLNDNYCLSAQRNSSDVFCYTYIPCDEELHTLCVTH